MMKKCLLIGIFLIGVFPAQAMLQTLPKSIEETSLRSPKQLFVDWVTSAKVREPNLSDVILAPEIAAQITTVAESLENRIKNNSSGV